jgi:hypothetical protein
VLGRNVPEADSKAAAAAVAADGGCNNVNNSIYDSDCDRQELGPLSWTAIARLNWRLCVAVFVLYACTLSIFPGFLAGERQQPGCLAVAEHSTAYTININALQRQMLLTCSA